MHSASDFSLGQFRAAATALISSGGESFQHDCSVDFLLVAAILAGDRRYLDRAEDTHVTPQRYETRRSSQKGWRVRARWRVLAIRLLRKFLQSFVLRPGNAEASPDEAKIREGHRS